MAANEYLSITGVPNGVAEMSTCPVTLCTSSSARMGLTKVAVKHSSAAVVRMFTWNLQDANGWRASLCSAIHTARGRVSARGDFGVERPCRSTRFSELRHAAVMPVMFPCGPLLFSLFRLGLALFFRFRLFLHLRLLGVLGVLGLGRGSLSRSRGAGGLSSAGHLCRGAHAERQQSGGCEWDGFPHVSPPFVDEIRKGATRVPGLYGLGTSVRNPIFIAPPSCAASIASTARSNGI